MTKSVLASFSVAALFSAFSVFAQGEKPAPLNVPQLDAPPKLENFLSMKPNGEIEQSMSKVSQFTQREPRDGRPATLPMDAYLGHDANNLYVVFVAYDDPAKVRARLSRREDVFRDDIVEIMIDTFYDQRRAYAFVSNPLGVQWDAIWTEGERFDDSFDTLWRSEGKLTDEGFVVLMAIPFKSLRFPSGDEQTWGVILIRETQRGPGEFSAWPWISSRISGRLSQEGTMKISVPISPGRNMQIIPYATYRAFRLQDEDAATQQFISDNFNPDAGADAKFVLKDKFTLDLTVNPDFNQVESDRPQITVNRRFEVFFDEKRPFFLENANYFNTPYNLVFTRRIREPQFGARLTGKTGPYAIGALLSDDISAGKRITAGDPGHGDRAAFGVLRISRDVFNQSNIGVLLTDREFANTYNRVAAVDGRFRLSDNWSSDIQAVWSRTRTDDGETFSAPAFQIELDRSGRKFDWRNDYQQIGRDFRASSGFVRRTDLREASTFLRYSFRPEGKTLISWGPEIRAERLWDLNNLRLDDQAEIGVEFEFNGQTELNIEYGKERERLRPQDFDGLTENLDLSQSGLSIRFESSLIDQFQVEGDLGFGEQANFDPPPGEFPHIADYLTGEFELNLLPITRLRIDNSYLFFRLNEQGTGDQILSNHIIRSRWGWQFNRKFSLRLIFQYDKTTVNPFLTSEDDGKNFNVDFLLTYLVNPWTAFYAGVNSNYVRNPFSNSDPRSSFMLPSNEYLNDGRQFFVKYSYLFRF